MGLVTRNYSVIIFSLDFLGLRSDRNNNHFLIITFFCGSQEDQLEEVEWSLAFGRQMIEAYFN